MKIHKIFEKREASTQNLETRMVTGLEVRKSEDDKKKQGLRGYAAVFNSETELWNGVYERIAKGAFSEDLKNSADVRALIDHDTGRVLGRTKAGTLTLKEDDKGLLMEVDLPDTQDARDLMVSVERGDIDQMSFGFRVRKQTWEERPDNDLRTIEDVELLEVSVVTFPAYPDTEVGKRSHNEFRDTRKKDEPSYEARLQRLTLAHETNNKLEGDI